MTTWACSQKTFSASCLAYVPQRPDHASKNSSRHFTLAPGHANHHVLSVRRGVFRMSEVMLHTAASEGADPLYVRVAWLMTSGDTCQRESS